MPPESVLSVASGRFDRVRRISPQPPFTAESFFGCAPSSEPHEHPANPTSATTDSAATRDRS
jgi:hypothetical protein